MAFTYGFYNSSKGDRRYNAEQFGEIFDGILRDGIIPNMGQLFVVRTANNGMQITVGTGRAWFDHTWSKNDSLMVLTVPTPDATRPRYDAVVLEVNHNEEIRANSIKIVQGDALVNPIKPVLVNTGKIHQYPLAYIRVEPAVETIAASKIENMVGREPTVFATGILEVVPIDQLWSQWNGEFDEWFDNVKSQLEGNVVTNLQRQIDALSARTPEKATVSEARAATNDKKFMTPYTVAQEIDALSHKISSSDGTKMTVGMSNIFALKGIYPHRYQGGVVGSLIETKDYVFGFNNGAYLYIFDKNKFELNFAPCPLPSGYGSNSILLPVPNTNIVYILTPNNPIYKVTVQAGGITNIVTLHTFPALTGSTGATISIGYGLIDSSYLYTVTATNPYLNVIIKFVNINTNQTTTFIWPSTFYEVAPAFTGYNDALYITGVTEIDRTARTFTITVNKLSVSNLSIQSVASHVQYLSSYVNMQINYFHIYISTVYDIKRNLLVVLFRDTYSPVSGSTAIDKMFVITVQNDSKRSTFDFTSFAEDEASASTIQIDVDNGNLYRTSSTGIYQVSYVNSIRSDILYSLDIDANYGRPRYVENSGYFIVKITQTYMIKNFLIKYDGTKFAAYMSERIMFHDFKTTSNTIRTESNRVFCFNSRYLLEITQSITSLIDLNSRFIYGILE